MTYRKYQTTLEHRRVLSVAREYRSEGYDVTIYPEAGDLPAELSSCPIDLVARGEDRVVAVEVRTRESLTRNGSEDLRRIAENVEGIPGWIFELVVTNPRKTQNPKAQSLSSV